MNQRKLNRILKAHSAWMIDPTAGKPAIFINKDLSGLTFNEEFSLEYIIFRDCNLSYADFSGQDLKHTIFGYCDLSHATFYHSDLRGSFFHRCNLNTTNFSKVDLSNSTIDKWEKVEEDNIEHTDFTNVRLSYSYCNKRLFDFAYPTIVPTHGSFIGWKKCRTEDNDVIVKLLIPEDAERCGGIARKCRTNKAVILDIQDFDGNSLPNTIATSIYNPDFKYKIGETIIIDNYDPNPHETCAPGIHFFITRHEAINY